LLQGLYDRRPARQGNLFEVVKVFEPTDCERANPPWHGLGPEDLSKASIEPAAETWEAKGAIRHGEHRNDRLDVAEVDSGHRASLFPLPCQPLDRVYQLSDSLGLPGDLVTLNKLSLEIGADRVGCPEDLWSSTEERALDLTQDQRVGIVKEKVNLPRLLGDGPGDI
jgi:hypothetical protein